MKTIGLVTTSRADYSIYRPVCKRIELEPELNLELLVSGTHLSPEFGLTANEIEQDGHKIAERVEMLLSSDLAVGVAKSMGMGLIGFAQVFARSRPDILIVLGDRFEMHSAALAALPFNIPVAHIHGGELTLGAIDDALRHSITKLSHLHFVSNHEHKRRVEQLGEESWRIVVCGAPALDNLTGFEAASLTSLSKRVGLNLQEKGFLLVTFHPTTLEYGQVATQTSKLLSALDKFDGQLVISMPNADTAGSEIRKQMSDYSRRHHDRAVVVENLGSELYFSMMSHALAMVGNSSSGLIEAPSFALPVVNVGNRQLGRTRALNVIDVGYETSQIIAGLQRALSAEFRQGLVGLTNPYGDGHAADKIAEYLSKLELTEDLTAKRFVDLSKTVTSKESSGE